jgi:hypothetical protein
LSFIGQELTLPRVFFWGNLPRDRPPNTNHMNELAQLVGFIAAHAIWCVADEQPLVQMIGFQRQDGSRSLVRFADPDMGRGVAQARAWLQTNPEQAMMAVAALDGFYPMASGKADAIILEGRLYASTVESLEMAVPYRPKSAAASFLVYRPKFIRGGGEKPDYSKLGDRFFAGVDGHSEGAKVWNAHMDQGQ